MIPIGILRSPSDQYRQKYVFLAPSKETLIDCENDEIYVISSEERRDLDEKNKNYSEMYSVDLIERSNVMLNDLSEQMKKSVEDINFNLRKELSVKNYEDKNDNEKLKNKNKRLDEKIEEVLQDENAKYILYLKEKCSDFIEKIKKGEKEYKNLIKYEGNSISGLEDEKIDIIEQQLLDYMVYKRDKEKLDEYNLKLGEKNLVLI